MVGRRAATHRISTPRPRGGPTTRSRVNNSFSGNVTDPGVGNLDSISPPLRASMSSGNLNLDREEAAAANNEGPGSFSQSTGNLSNVGIQLPPRVEGTRELPLPPPSFRPPPHRNASTIQNLLNEEPVWRSSSSTQGAPSTSDLTSILNLMSQQTRTMNDQFNFMVSNQSDQLRNQQTMIETMRHEFLVSQRHVATELSQTREALSLSSQLNRRGQNPQTRFTTPSSFSNPIRSSEPFIAGIPVIPPQQSVFAFGSNLSSSGTHHAAPQPIQGGHATAVNGNGTSAAPLLSAPVVEPTAPEVLRPRGLPTFHLKAAEIPRYKGAEETQTPYDFIIDLDKYKAISRSSDEFMIKEIAPLALQGQAFNWYRFESSYSPFESYDDFKIRFRKEFQPIGYAPELSRELELRTQGPTEPLTVFIRVIVDYYKRLGQNPSDAEIVNRIKRQMHPEYMQALQGKVIVTLRELMDAAFDAQDLIKAYRAYKPPPIVAGVEPSLQWKPLDSASQPARKESSTFTSLPERSNPRLHPHGIDPYTFFHGEKPVSVQSQYPRKVVSFGETYSAPPNAQPKVESRANNVSNGQPSANSEFRSRPSSPGVNTNRSASPLNNRSPTPPRATQRLCFNCRSPEHLLADCPHPRDSSRSPGNSPIPSPSRR